MRDPLRITVFIFAMLSWNTLFCGAERFIWPGNGIEAHRKVWGHANGLQIGLWEGDSPQGLMLVRAPYLQLPRKQIVNFLSVEPSLPGSDRRGQSELEISRHRPGERGLSFYASNSREIYDRQHTSPSGIYDEEAGTLTIFVHTEPFRNGIHPVVRLRFHESSPYEVEISTFTKKGSKEIAYCTVSATMGNYSVLRELHLRDGKTVEANDLWSDDHPVEELGFLPWKTVPSDQFEKLPDGRLMVGATSNYTDSATIPYPEGTGKWVYEGLMTRQYWIAPDISYLEAAVNARKTYWAGIPPRHHRPIPGGPSFENFELRLPHKDGQSIWFGVEVAD